jgi:uncharacterized protein (TIGR02996 family)
MTGDEKAFLAAIAAAPGDDAPRLVFADWLDERGRDSEAAEQRRRTTPEYHAAVKWFAEEARNHRPSYHDDDSPELTPEQLIDYGHTYLDSGDVFCQYGSTSMQDIDMGAYWDNWEVLTGIKVGPEKRDDFYFRCSC